MGKEPQTIGPIDAYEALVRVEVKLIELLDGLSPEDWNRPTLVQGWHVRHIAGHLLDTALRKLSMVRDGFFSQGPASNSPQDVRKFIDRLNADGAAVYGSLSRQALTSLMRVVSPQFCDWHRKLDPNAPALFPVTWAGEDVSAQWFDTARELTERWHHQEQIRLAVGQESLMTRELYHPVLDCFLRVLPFTYQDVPAEPGASMVVRIEGDSGGEWRLWRDANGWRMVERVPEPPQATVTIPEAIAWRLFTKGIARNLAEPMIRCEGDRDLASHLFRAIAIVG
jgi:uncharacterized protein (TIGR03083 family)